MAAQREPFDAGRFFLDTTYAYQRLAAAHSSNDAALQSLALLLFDRYQTLDQRRGGMQLTAH